MVEIVTKMQLTMKFLKLILLIFKSPNITCILSSKVHSIALEDCLNFQTISTPSFMTLFDHQSINVKASEVKAI